MKIEVTCRCGEGVLLEEFEIKECPNCGLKLQAWIHLEIKGEQRVLEICEYCGLEVNQCHCMMQG